MNLKSIKDYRAYDVDSYSTLKDFDTSPKYYYEKYILKKDMMEKETEEMIMGSLVDTLLFAPDEYEKNFMEADIKEIERGRNQMADFTLELWRLTQMYSDSKGVLSKSFLEIAEEALRNIKYNREGEEIRFRSKNIVYVLEKFHNSDYERWYQMKRSGINKKIISLKQRQDAEFIVNQVNNFIQSKFFDSKRYSIFYHPRIAFNLLGLPFKCELDMVVFDIENKEIFPLDLKLTSNFFNFEYNYIKYKYYIQAFCYGEALKVWVKSDPMFKGMDIQVLPMRFIVADSSCVYHPVLYGLTDLDLYKAANGFSLQGKYYRGVKQIIKNLLYAKANDDYTIFADIKETISKYGFIPLAIYYDEKALSL